MYLMIKNWSGKYSERTNKYNYELSIKVKTEDEIYNLTYHLEMEPKSKRYKIINIKDQQNQWKSKYEIIDELNLIQNYEIRLEEAIKAYVDGTGSFGVLTTL